MPDRSAGVQQGLKAATAELERVMTGTVKVQLPGPWYPQVAEAVVAAYRDVVEAVSPEPRCLAIASPAAGGPLRCELTAGHEGEHYNGGTASGYWSDREAEPREGEQETVPLIRRGRVTPELSLTDEEREDAAGPPPDPSVARELRLTASRLRDPEYHWYEHAAVTLERLAEKLETQEGERQQIIEEARRELPERDRRYGEGMGRLRDIAGPEKGRDE